MKKVNKIKAIFSQHLPENGNVPEFNEVQEFTSETTQAVSARTLAIWLLGQMKHFVKLQRLQGKAGFKMSKPIELKLTVNNKTEKLGFKFSLNLERIEKLIETTPDLVQEAFTIAPSIPFINANSGAALDYLTTNGNAIVCKAVKEPKAELPVDEVSVGHKLLEEVLA